MSAHDALIIGFENAATFLSQQGIYSKQDLPYSSQLIPLSAIFAFDYQQGGNKHLVFAQNKELLSKWYWCGVFGELYGGTIG